jgi:hypothetical protein
MARSKKMQQTPEEAKCILARPQFSYYGLEGLATGAPVILYHGTVADFSQFDLDKSREELVNKFYGRGIFLTPSKKIAWMYANANRNSGLPPSLIDDLSTINVNAGNFLRALYLQGRDAWESYPQIHGFLRDDPAPGEGRFDSEGFERHLGGVNANMLSDIAEYIIGAAREPNSNDSVDEIFNFLVGQATGTADWVYDNLDEIGVDSTKYRPKVLTVEVTANKPLVTGSTEEARAAPSLGHDSVVYHGPDLVGGVVEVAVHDPRKVRILRVEV